MHSYYSPGKEFPFSEIHQTEDNRREKKGSAGDEQNLRRIINTVVLSWQLADFVIARSFREVESKYIDYLSTLLGKEVVPTGPLIPDIGSVSPGDCQGPRRQKK